MAFSGNGFIAKTHNGQAPEILYGAYEANSQTFKKGQLVYLNSGAVTVVADNGTLVMGFAMKDATNVTSGNIEIPVMIIQPGDEVVMPLCTSGTAALSTAFTLGTSYGINVDHPTTNVTFIDSAVSSYDVAVFVRNLYDGAGSARYYGLFTFEAGALQASTGA